MTQDIIFTPLPFRNLEIKNRIFRSSVSGRFDNEDGSLSQTRINWESKFAKGGTGAIISSYVPVLMEGRIIAGYATVHRDEYIPLWQKLGEAVHSFDCKFIMQLSHSGRQMDIPGVHNYPRPTQSSTSKRESLHGFLCRAMTTAEIHYTIDAFAKGAWRAQQGGLDGVDLGRQPAAPLFTRPPVLGQEGGVTIGAAKATSEVGITRPVEAAATDEAGGRAEDRTGLDLFHRGVLVTVGKIPAEMLANAVPVAHNTADCTSPNYYVPTGSRFT